MRQQLNKLVCKFTDAVRIKDKETKKEPIWNFYEHLETRNLWPETYKQLETRDDVQNHQIDKIEKKNQLDN